MAEKHQLAIAWDEWIAGRPGVDDPSTLGAGRQYLKNRLWHAFMAGAAAVENRPPCLWTPDPTDGGWDASCGGKWELSTGTPADNNMRFCPFCGRRLEVKETTAHER